MAVVGTEKDEETVTVDRQSRDAQRSSPLSKSGYPQTC